jgi:hypothetical protein
MSYCTPDDLLFGDMSVSSSNAVRWISAAEDEINQRLGVMYVLPPAPPAEELTLLLLKRLAVLTATGRGMMAQPAAGEDNGVNAYGRYLLEDAEKLFYALLSGETILPGVDKQSELIASGNAPSVVTEDSVAAVDAFYGFATRGEYTLFTPGA